MIILLSDVVPETETRNLAFTRVGFPASPARRHHRDDDGGDFAVAASWPMSCCALTKGERHLADGSGIVSQVRDKFLLAPRFVALGLTLAVIESPSDESSGIGTQVRSTADRATDIAAVVALLKSRSPAPIWLIGTVAARFRRPMRRRIIVSDQTKGGDYGRHCVQLSPL